MAVQKVLESGCGTKYSSDGTVASTRVDGHTHVHKRQKHDASDDDEGKKNVSILFSVQSLLSQYSLNIVTNFTCSTNFINAATISKVHSVSL